MGFPYPQGLLQSKVAIGGSGNLGDLGGSINVQTASTAPGSTAEEVLYTYTIPANTFDKNGRFIWFWCQFLHASNANSVTARLRLGGLTGTVLGTITSIVSAARLGLYGYVIRTASNAQKICLEGHNGASGVNQPQVTDTQTDTGTIALVMTGEAPTTATDISAEAMVLQVGG